MAPDAEGRLAAIAGAFLADPEVSRGKLFSAWGLKVRGKIFAMVTRGRLVVKLPRARVDSLVAQGLGDRFDPGHGRLMKEWLSLRGHEPDWRALMAEAKDFVAGAANAGSSGEG